MMISVFELEKIYSIPEDKMLALSKLETFAAYNFILAQMIRFLFDWVEDIVEKGENAAYQQFLRFSLCFSKGFFSKVFINLGLFGKGLRHIMKMIKAW